MIFRDIGMATASLVGSLETKLAAVRSAGFSQVMIAAADVVSHPGGTAAGVRAVLTPSWVASSRRGGRRTRPAASEARALASWIGVTTQ